MQGHDGLLPHSLGRMIQQPDHLGTDRPHEVRCDEIRYRDECTARFEEVGGDKVTLHLVDEHEAEGVIGGEAAGADHVAASIMPQHFHIQNPHQKLPRLLLIRRQRIPPRRHASTGSTGNRRRNGARLVILELFLKDGNLVDDDAVFFLFGFGFADGLDEFEELSREVHARHGGVMVGDVGERGSWFRPS
eukprot:CCRYP_014413-RB/>CCRYP_014413-RB protein AED:0.45 eAED:1.00 QI:0/0/0/1/0/0/2/0/189